jgi:hypothetical protein
MNFGLSVVSPDHEPDVAFHWIHAITQATMQLYLEQILKIPHLSHQSAQQLSTDIGMNMYTKTGNIFDWVMSI